ncbi:sigma-70 family RNA polymerase sigma factor [Candidatus Uhrbacteria bacterium]|nr:sigma-70 family RNA polymerase sigma factor [Candidatus Uhrbacteria bacterium]
MKTDEQLVADYLAGERSAFDELVRRHLGAAYGFARKILGNDHDAEDAAQEAFVKAWRGLRSFDLEQNFRAWLFRIARNAAYDLRKKKRPSAFAEMDAGAPGMTFAETIADRGPSLAEAVDRAGTAETVHAALIRLPECYRRVLHLRFVEDLTFREIGEVLGAPLDTVKCRCRRGLIRLKKLLAGAAPMSSPES